MYAVKLTATNTSRPDSGRLCGWYPPCLIRIIHYLAPLIHRQTCARWIRASLHNWLVSSVNF